jgi:hypothetical protein
MRPEDRDATLDVLFESAIAINEWITFESLFSRQKNPTIVEDVGRIRELLPSVYSRALLLLAEIQYSCDKNWFMSRRKC